MYVTFASVSGASGGYVEVFKEDGTPARPTPLIKGYPLSQPWGVAIAPKNFGPLSNTLLISNNTDHGTINAFNAVSGQFVGALKDTSGKAILIDQLWGIGFGDGLGKNGKASRVVLYRWSRDNLAGTFGVIGFKP